MSITSCIYSIAAAILASEEFLGPNRIWYPTNATQKRFLDMYYEIAGDVEKLKDVISTRASRDAAVLNKFLEERGFSIRLDPFEDPGDFGTAAVLDLLVEWAERGKRTAIKTPDSKSYDGVRLDKSNVSFFSVKSHDNPIVQLTTKSGDEVFITMYDNPPTDIFDLIMLCENLQNSPRAMDRFGGLRFPMVDLRQRVNIGWLLHMNTTGDDGLPGIIDQALKENRLRLNDEGARAQSAVALGVIRGVSRPLSDHTIDRPFLIWFSRSGMQLPLFAAHVTPEDWKDPGDIHTV